MRRSIWWLALLAAVGAMPGAEAQESTRQTVGVELRGDTMVYRAISLPGHRHGGMRGKAWSNYSHTPWTAEQKLFALSKFWMEVRRNFAYMDRFGVERWDSLYRAMITPVQQSRNDVAFYRQLEGLCAQLRNEQTFIRHSRDFPMSAAEFEQGWTIRLMDVGGHVMVSEVSRDKASILPPGSEILAVDGQPVEAKLGREMSYVAASTDRVRRRLAVERVLLGLVGTPHEVSFRRPDGTEGSVRLVNARHEPGQESECVALPGRAWQDLHEDFRLTWYPGDVACLKIGSFRPGRVFRAFHDAFPEVRARARKLIIDLRWNEFGSSRMAAEFLSHLTRDTVLYGTIWRTRVYDAALASWGADATPADTVKNARVKIAYEHYNDAAFSDPERSEYRFSHSRDVLEVPTVILINDATGSAAESFLAIAASQPHMSTVGTSTSGCAGMVALYELLPGLQCGICTSEMRLPDGKEFVGRGVAPDVVVEDTPADLLAGRDAALEKALELLGEE